MLKNISGKEEEIIMNFCREIVDAIADSNYTTVFEKVDEANDWNATLLSDAIEHFKEDNDLQKIDKYDVPCTFNPKYSDGSKYMQEDIYIYNDNSGFGYEYQLTTDGEPNDLILSLQFLFEGEYLKVIFESGITI
ncbi:hypothetical protein CSC2_09300 [Clostridium zeae]|uniref:DUF7668 domain-containing protein n=1 Tax=Clostridium zeae TaxID=2759022 RepID=A0ABQ1E6N0_9CLOT|nr:hypothetical protein [Clostridium zeae]GFZ30404.1 hypothetical protein CSC2_09300 [Clostridium zeae]